MNKQNNLCGCGVCIAQRKDDHLPYDSGWLRLAKILNKNVIQLNFYTIVDEMLDKIKDKKTPKKDRDFLKNILKPYEDILN